MTEAFISLFRSTGKETVGDGAARHVGFVGSRLPVKGVAVPARIFLHVPQQLGVVPGFDVATVILVEVGQPVVDEDVALKKKKKIGT